ncbi:MAG: hypothetical protein HEQ32_06530 [Vampirovibrio sp.]
MMINPSSFLGMRALDQVPHSVVSFIPTPSPAVFYEPLTPTTTSVNPYAYWEPTAFQANPFFWNMGGGYLNPTPSFVTQALPLASSNQTLNTDSASTTSSTVSAPSKKTRVTLMDIATLSKAGVSHENLQKVSNGVIDMATAQATVSTPTTPAPTTPAPTTPQTTTPAPTTPQTTTPAPTMPQTTTPAPTTPAPTMPQTTTPAPTTPAPTTPAPTTPAPTTPAPTTPAPTTPAPTTPAPTTSETKAVDIASNIVSKGVGATLNSYLPQVADPSANILTVTTRQAARIMKGDTSSKMTDEIYSPVNEALYKDAGLSLEEAQKITAERKDQAQRATAFGNTPYASVNYKKSALIEMSRYDREGALKLQNDLVEIAKTKGEANKKELEEAAKRDAEKAKAAKP